MQVTLVYFKPDGGRKDIAFDKPSIVIGRRPDCDVRVPQLGVSRRHCELVVRGESLVVRDLGSSNGTYVNGARISGEDVLAPGTRLQVGPVLLTVQIDGRPADVAAPPPAAAAKAAAKASKVAAKAPSKVEDDLDADEEDIFAQMMMDDDDEDEDDNDDDSMGALEMLEDDQT
ncbi:MAG: FHA domain-containing protein [Planctomycetes bacterium]|nr:FHA domain-containing protein [Planctomycetota bacterium]